MPKDASVLTNTFIEVPQRTLGPMDPLVRANSPTVTHPSSRCLYLNRPKNLLGTVLFHYDYFNSPHPPIFRHLCHND